MINEIQNDQAIVRQYGEFTVGACLVAISEASATQVFSSLTTIQEAGELNEHVTNAQTAQRQADQPARKWSSRRKSRVTLGPPTDGKQSHVLKPGKGEQVGKSSSRKAGGPRTREGKLRSRHNARKHGIFSKELVLKNESRAEYEKLWYGLWEDFQPRGTLKTEIFKNMVFNRWNKRRLHRALNAEIAENVEYLEFDRNVTLRAKAWNSEQWGGPLGGMLTPGCNHFELMKGIEFLKQIRSSVEARGFNVGMDRDLLVKLYGVDSDGKTHSGVFHFYLFAASSASVGQEEKQNADPDKYKKTMLELLDEEIKGLGALANAVLDMDRMRSRYRVDRALVPSQKMLNLYMRYDVHLDRQFYRDLNMLFDRSTG
jgi:hypothetical protein